MVWHVKEEEQGLAFDPYNPRLMSLGCEPNKKIEVTQSTLMKHILTPLITKGESGVTILTRCLRKMREHIEAAAALHLEADVAEVTCMADYLAAIRYIMQLFC